MDASGNRPPENVVATIRKVVTDVLNDVRIEDPRSDPPLIIPAVKERPQLAFAPVTLGSREPRAMREAVARLNSADARKRFEGAGLKSVAATPNWFGAAQNCEGGSPASLPVPVDPHGSQIRYAPQYPELDLATKAADSAWAKTGWVVLVLFLPIIGALVYLASQSTAMGERALRRLALRSPLRTVAGRR